MKKLTGAVAAIAITVGMGIATTAPASAASNIKAFGQPETLLDPVTGFPTITYTVEGLNPSSDAVPHNGQLYEAVVNVEARGAMPMVTMFNARAESGANYRVIGGGIPGKLYFDVVGDVPNSVVYNDGGQDLLAWVSTGPMDSGAPDVAGESTEDIGGAPPAGPETTGDDVAPPVEAPGPFELTEPEVAEPGFNDGGGRR